MLENIYMIISLTSVIYIVYSLFMRPINLRYQRALDRLLAKEIARSIYQSMHHEFTYDNKYRPDDLQSQLILNTAMEEFMRLE